MNISQQLTTTAIGTSITVSLRALKLIQEYMMNTQLYGITLYIEDYNEVWESEVSQKKIINSAGGKTVISDNIAPHPIAWNFTAHIKAEPYEFTSRFVPSLKRKKALLKKAKDSRQFVNFRDKDGDTFKVGIQNINWQPSSENMNTLKFSCSLIECNSLESAISTLETVQNKATSQDGSADGAAKQAGTTKSDDRSTLYKGIVDKDLSALVGGG